MPLLLYVYQNGKRWSAQWGFCDFGQCLLTNNPIYFFKHGFSYTEKAPGMPKQFTIYIENKTNHNIDSVKSKYPKGIQFISDLKSNPLKIICNYSLIREGPILYLFSQKKYEIDLSYYDWENWGSWEKSNSTEYSTYLILYETGIKAQY